MDVSAPHNATSSCYQFRIKWFVRSCVIGLAGLLSVHAHAQAEYRLESVCTNYLRVTQEIMPLDEVEVTHEEPRKHNPFSVTLRVPSTLDDRIIDSARIELRGAKYRFQLHPRRLTPLRTYFQIHVPQRDLRRAKIWFRYDGAGICRGATGDYFDYVYPLANAMK